MQLPEPLITVSPDFLSGAPIFTGTRVPVRNLFDYLEGGEPLEEFLLDFPNVSREHAIAVLERAKATLLAAPRPDRVLGTAITKAPSLTQLGASHFFSK
jgi:uncharacterized protein (DUF433 family)